MRMHNPPHPGKLVKLALIEGAGLSVTEASERLGVARTTFSRLINCHIGISPEMAVRLSMLLNTSAEVWIGMQKNYDLWHAEKKRKRFKIQPLSTLEQPPLHINDQT